MTNEVNWDDLDKLWSSFEITITEEGDNKEAKFIFKDYDSLVWTLKTFAKHKGESNERYTNYKIDEMTRYVAGIPNPLDEDGEELEYWEQYDKDGLSFQLEEDSVIVFPKIPAITYSGYSFHHFFQHMFDWLPRDLDRALHSLDNRRLTIATFIDGDLSIPVSRGMISSGFMIHSQKTIDDDWQNSIKKWFIALDADDRFKAKEIEDEPK